MSKSTRYIPVIIMGKIPPLYFVMAWTEKEFVSFVWSFFIGVIPENDIYECYTVTIRII